MINVDQIACMEVGASFFSSQDFDIFDYFPTQLQAIETLVDTHTKFFLYGGGAGGGKTWTGWEWLLWSSLAYPGIKSFVGRNELKRLRQTTLQTFFKVCKKYKVDDSIYRLNMQDNVIIFSNGSRIDLLDLQLLPRDPLYERFGSYEYTFGWLEEAGEIQFAAYDVLKSRIGRQLNDKYNLFPKLYLTCNPKRNWLYRLFYTPFKKGDLPGNTKFLQSLAKDNPKIDSSYIENLSQLTDVNLKMRLQFGDWEYDSDPAKIINSDQIQELFTNSWVEPGVKYISADVARYGSDKTVIGVWSGYQLIELEERAHSSVVETFQLIEHLRIKHKISRMNVVCDDDGVGGGVNDQGRYRRFINNSASVKQQGNPTNYKNLADQCGFKAAEKINKGEMWINCPLSEKQKEDIINELEVIKRDNPDGDKLCLLPKAQIKDLIGRSPDYWDMIKQRMFFDVSLRSNPKV